MIQQSIFTPLIKPCSLLFRDIKRIFFLLPNKLRASVLTLFILMGFQAAAELLTILSLTHIGKSVGGATVLEDAFPYNFLFEVFPQLHITAQGTPQEILPQYEASYDGVLV